MCVSFRAQGVGFTKVVELWRRGRTGELHVVVDTGTMCVLVVLRVFGFFGLRFCRIHKEEPRGSKFAI